MLKVALIKSLSAHLKYTLQSLLVNLFAPVLFSLKYSKYSKIGILKGNKLENNYFVHGQLSSLMSLSDLLQMLEKLALGVAPAFS